MPAQLKVLYGKTLILFQLIYRVSSALHCGKQAHLLREEVVQTSRPQDLRKLTGIPERIRQEGFPADHPKLLLEVPLAVEVVADKRLARWHHAVMFEPSAANGVEATLLDVVCNTSECFRVERLEPVVLHGGGRGELVAGKAVHEVDLRGPASSDLTVSTFHHSAKVDPPSAEYGYTARAKLYQCDCPLAEGQRVCPSCTHQCPIAQISAGRSFSVFQTASDCTSSLPSFPRTFHPILRHLCSTSSSSSAVCPSPRMNAFIMSSHALRAF